MNPAYDFKDEVALVTGASSGIGPATAKAFAEAGAAVVLVHTTESALRAATEGLTSAGHRAISVTCKGANRHALIKIGRCRIYNYSSYHNFSFFDNYR